MTMSIMMMMILLSGTKAIKNISSESKNKERVNAYCLASIKMARLVRPQRREKRDTEVVEATDICFWIPDMFLNQ